MRYKLEKDPNRLQVFYELTKRRIYVGELSYDAKKDFYRFSYDKKYANSRNAIPLGPELDLFKLEHTSKNGKLFTAFVDRIPERANPAYKDYCLLQGISPNEQNPIILLGAIGHRGPSSFIFEPVYTTSFTSEQIKKLRDQLNISQHDLARAFGISKNTLQRIETGISNDLNTIKLLQIYLTFPNVAIWQLTQAGTNVHSTVLRKLLTYFQQTK